LLRVFVLEYSGSQASRPNTFLRSKHRINFNNEGVGASLFEERSRLETEQGVCLRWRGQAGSFLKFRRIILTVSLLGCYRDPREKKRGAETF